MVLTAPDAEPGEVQWGLTTESYSGGERLVATTPFASLLTDLTETELDLPPQDHTFITSMIAEPDPRIEVIVDGDNNGTGEELMFGNTIASSIHGLKFLDRDADGIYSPENGDVPQAGVTFLLTGIGRGNVPINRLVVTDEDGQFWFEDLPQSIAGEGKQSGYTVTEIVPNDFFPTTGNTQRTYNLAGGIELAWQEGAAMLDPVLDPQREMVIGQNLMFGNAAKGSIHGFKFLDINGNGLYEPDIGETPTPGVRFLLDGIDANGMCSRRTALTDENGEFWFVDLWPSVNGRGRATGYTVKEIVPTDFIPTTPESRLINLFSNEEMVWQRAPRCCLHHHSLISISSRNCRIRLRKRSEGCWGKRSLRWSPADLLALRSHRQAFRLQG